MVKIAEIIGEFWRRLDRIVTSAGPFTEILTRRHLWCSTGRPETRSAAIRVVGINPGFTDTERMETLMRKHAQDRLGDPGRYRELYAPLPFGRAAKPDEIAWMIAFLASDLSAYTSGTVITIDAGVANKRNAT